MSSSATPNTCSGQKPFSIEVKRLADGILLNIRGSCTMEVAGQLSDRVLAAASESPAVMYLDLSELDFIESTGLGGIVGGYLRVRRNHGDVRLIGPRLEIRKLLDLTRLTQLFTVHATLADAQKQPAPRS